MHSPKTLMELMAFLKLNTKDYCWFKSWNPKEGWFKIVANGYGEGAPYVLHDLVFYLDDKTEALVTYLVNQFFKGRTNEEDVKKDS